jgi:hypothetical protein
LKNFKGGETSIDEVISEGALKMMKYEKVHCKKISNDLITDLTVTQGIYRMLYYECKPAGYLQDIMLSPFGFLLLSEMQVFK